MLGAWKRTDIDQATVLPGAPLVAACRGLCGGLAGLTQASVFLPLSLHAGRLVAGVTLGLRENAVLLDLAGEPLEGYLEGIALANENLTHSLAVAGGRMSFIARRPCISFSILVLSLLAGGPASWVVSPLMQYTCRHIL